LERLLFLWKYISPLRYKLALSLLALTFVSLTSLIFPWLLKLMIDRFSEPMKAGPGITTLALILAAVFILSTVFGYYTYVRMQEMGIVLRNTLRASLFGNLLYRPMSFFKIQKVGELSARATEDLGKLQPFFAGLVTTIFQNILFICGCIILMILINAIATLLAVVIILLPLPFFVIYSKKIRKLSFESQQEHAFANALFEESLIGIRDVKSLVIEGLHLNLYSSRLERAKDKELSSWKFHSGVTQTIYFILSMILLVVFYTGTVNTGSAWSLGGAIAFYFYAYTLTMAFLSLGRSYLNYSGTMGAVDRIAGLLKEVEPERTMAITTDHPVKGNIEFCNVDFSYDNVNQVFTGFSFKVKPGSWIVITGPSGSGKSTIASLILNFYQPQSGEILLDGISLCSYDNSFLRGNIGFTGQDPILFSGSIKENILISHPETSQERFAKVINICCLDEFISQLPEGTDTLIGERGITISGGQKSRIAIARAIINNPPILILDEANSMLEAELEQKLWNNLIRDRKDKTTIILSHHIENIPKIFTHIELTPLQVQEQGS
jgi:ABC-type multidrug transport system fused ATPase/permease subunit